jgi:hypothetical protein
MPTWAPFLNGYLMDGEVTTMCCEFIREMQMMEATALESWRLDCDPYRRAKFAERYARAQYLQLEHDRDACPECQIEKAA